MSNQSTGFIPEIQPRSVLSFKRQQVVTETIQDMEEVKAKEFEMSLIEAGIAFYLGEWLQLRTRWKQIINECRQKQHHAISDSLAEMTGEKLHRVAGSLLSSRGIET